MTKTKTLVEEYLEDPDHMRLFQQERAIFEVTQLIESLMEEKCIGRSDLARLLGQSKSWVTQLLDGEKNKTIRTIADTFAVLGFELRVFASPIRDSKDWKPLADNDPKWVTNEWHMHLRLVS